MRHVKTSMAACEAGMVEEIAMAFTMKSAWVEEAAADASTTGLVCKVRIELKAAKLNSAGAVVQTVMSPWLFRFSNFNK
jgi:hypothetical protein